MLVGLRQPSSVVTFAMPDEHPLGPKGQSRHSVAKLTLRQADQARTDFAAIESNLEFIMSQLARVPTREAVGALLFAGHGRHGVPCADLGIPVSLIASDEA